MKELIIAAGVLLGVAGTGVQGISPQEIGTAIEQGRAGKTLQKKCGASGENGFEIVIEGPIGRIMRAAREAKRDDRGFTSTDVTPALSAPVLTVIARRDHTLSTASNAVPLKGAPGVWVMPEPAATDAARARSTMGYTYRTDFLLRSRPPGSDEPIVLKPLGRITYGKEKSGAEWTSPAGASARVPTQGSDMTASFDFAAFKAIPHRDVDVVIFMTDAGEHRCKISENDRRALR